MNTQLTKILSWNGTKFVCEDKKIESHILFKTRLALLRNKILVTEFLQSCDFQLIGYEYDDGFKIQKSEEVFFDIADEGTGFNIVFNLAGIALLEFDDHKNIDRIYIDSKSIKPNLHPLLFERISRNMGLQCGFLNPKDVRKYLKCTVNPLGDCGTCQHFKSGSNRIIQFR